MEHPEVRDGSRLSTDIIAPFFQHRMIDSTFVSTIRIKLQSAFFTVEMFPGNIEDASIWGKEKWVSKK